jgi:predicted negative regulator of RcsB-dependent stress response
MGRRITRKQLKKDDEFVSSAELIFQWIADNLRPLLAGVAAVCVLALVWWGATKWLSARANDASLLLNHAVTTFEGESVTGAAVPGGDVEAAEAAFQQVVDSYGRTDQGDMARLYLARIALGRGQVDEARLTFVELAQRHSDDLIGRLATLDLIDLRLASGQGAEVATELEAMVVGDTPALPRDVALFKLGEIFASQGEPDRARTYFERLVEEFPESPYLANARQQLSELG